MFTLISLITAALANDTLTVPLPEVIAEGIEESAPWQDDEASHTSQPIAWTSLDGHRIGDEHRLYDDSGALALVCEIEAFELREPGEEADEAEVWARLDCGNDIFASR